VGFALGRRAGLEPEQTSDATAGLLAQQHSPDRRDLLEMGGDVHRVTEDGVPALGPGPHRAGDDRAGVDADPHLHRGQPLGRELIGELHHGPLDG